MDDHALNVAAFSVDLDLTDRMQRDGVSRSHYPLRCDQYTVRLTRQVDECSKLRWRNPVFGVVNVMPNDDSTGAERSCEQQKEK
jgi:hypothetical protein